MMMDDDSVNKTMMPCMMMGDDSVNKTMMHFIVCDCMMFESMMDDDSVNKTMMPCMMMGDDSVNKTMMPCMMMDDDSVNKTMMPCMMMDDDSVNKTMMPCMMMDDDSVNKTMMPCMMMGDHLSNESCCIIKMDQNASSKMDQNASSAQAEMECAHLWLKKAMMMHHMHMKDPSTATNESQMEMMHHMMQAYECMTGENMTMEMIEETAYDGSAGWMDATVDDGSADYRSTNNGSAGC
jgi:hypothetical protein